MAAPVDGGGHLLRPRWWRGNRHTKTNRAFPRIERYDGKWLITRSVVGCSERKREPRTERDRIASDHILSLPRHRGCRFETSLNAEQRWPSGTAPSASYSPHNLLSCKRLTGCQVGSFSSARGRTWPLVCSTQVMDLTIGLAPRKPNQRIAYSQATKRAKQHRSAHENFMTKPAAFGLRPGAARVALVTDRKSVV